MRLTLRKMLHTRSNITSRDHQIVRRFSSRSKAKSMSETTDALDARRAATAPSKVASPCRARVTQLAAIACRTRCTYSVPSIRPTKVYRPRLLRSPPCRRRANRARPAAKAKGKKRPKAVTISSDGEDSDIEVCRGERYVCHPYCE